MTDTTPSAPLPDVADLSYEQARDELVQVVSSLERGTATLEESMRLWQRGTALADRCDEWLSGARRQLDEVLATQRGTADDERDA